MHFKLPSVTDLFTYPVLLMPQFTVLRIIIIRRRLGEFYVTYFNIYETLDKANCLNDIEELHCKCMYIHCINYMFLVTNEICGELAWHSCVQHSFREFTAVWVLESTGGGTVTDTALKLRFTQTLEHEWKAIHTHVPFESPIYMYMVCLTCTKLCLKLYYN